MQRIGYWFERMPLSILGGLGMFFFVSSIGSLLTRILFAFFQGGTIKYSPLYIMAVPLILRIVAAGAGGIFAGWLAKENGARLGLAISGIIVLFGVPHTIINVLSIWRAIGGLEGYQSLSGEWLMAIQEPVSWVLMLVAGWWGGIFGESLTKGENEGVSLL